MLTQVARFELRYQIRSPIFWITSFIFLALTWTLVTSDDLRIGWGGYVARNSPFAIATMCMIMVIFAIFIVTTFVSNVVLRDDESGFGPIVHATRLTKFDYLFGRFTGGFLATCLVFLSVPLGVLLATAMPGLDPGTIGPFRPGTYLYAYLVLCVPTLFVLSASFFSLATVTRSMIATYIVALVVLMAYLLTTTYFARKEFADIAAVLDPFGMSGFRSVTQHWTASERNSLLPPVVGRFLQNRLMWIAIAFALLAVTWRTYKSQSSSATKASKRGSAEEKAEHAPAAGPLPRPSTDTQSLGWGPLVALTKFDVLSVLRSPAYIVLLGIGFMNTVVGLWYAGEDNVSITLPVTRIMIKTLIDQFTLIPLIIAAYYAGELVWRDRERRVNEIVDATPSADWAFVVPKIIAIAIVLFSMALISVGAALCVQAIKGYFDFDFSHYLFWYVLPWLLNMVMYAVLAVFIQMLVPHKFGGLLISIAGAGGADLAVQARFRAQPLSLRQLLAGAAVRYERAGRVREACGVVPPVLDGVRDHARRARLRTVASRRIVAAEGPVATPAVAIARPGRLDRCEWRCRHGRGRRLYLLQHQCSQRVSDLHRQHPLGGGV